jgi:hypothetical protein
VLVEVAVGVPVAGRVAVGVALIAARGVGVVRGVAGTVGVIVLRSVGVKVGVRVAAGVVVAVGVPVPAAPTKVREGRSKTNVVPLAARIVNWRRGLTAVIVRDPSLVGKG